MSGGKPRKKLDRVSNTSDADEETISLQRLLLDAYEYHGLTNLLCYLTFLIIAIFALYTQWGDTASNFKSCVVENLLAYDTGDDWQWYQLRNVQSFVDGFQYVCGVLKSQLKKTDQAQLVNQTQVWVGQFAIVTFARLIVELNVNDCPTLTNGVNNTDLCIQWGHNPNASELPPQFMDWDGELEDDYVDYATEYGHADYTLGIYEANASRRARRSMQANSTNTALGSSRLPSPPPPRSSTPRRK